jgi:hypothetical protein
VQNLILRHIYKKKSFYEPCPCSTSKLAKSANMTQNFIMGIKNANVMLISSLWCKKTEAKKVFNKKVTGKNRVFDFMIVCKSNLHSILRVMMPISIFVRKKCA